MAVVGGAAVERGPVVEVRGIEVTFGAIRALRGVDLKLRAGEVHALVGANGAGKSTLAKVISGALVPDAGVVMVGGREAERAGLAAHQALGIAAIYQEATIVPHMTAAENGLLGRTRRRGPLVDRRRNRADFLAHCASLGITIDPDAAAGSLPVVQQRMVEIIRAIDARHDAILMDEPTGSLGPEEREAFYRLVADLTAAGASILLISHDLDEVLRLSDRVSVMRDGTLIDSRPTSSWSKDQMVRAMLGEEPRRVASSSRSASSEIALGVQDVSLPGRLRDVSFDLRRGEIVGIAGLVGAGRTELLRSIAGLEPNARGTLIVGGHARPLPRSVREAIRLGIAMTPEDRRREGIVPWMRSDANLVLSDLGSVSRAGVVSATERRARAAKVGGSIGLPDRMLDQPAATLSGGSQQKLVVGRWIHRPPSILLLDEPTIGIDVGAKQELKNVVRSIADAGTAVVVVSAEWEELIALADKILVLAKGLLVGTLDQADASIDRILRMVFKVDEES